MIFFKDIIFRLLLKHHELTSSDTQTDQTVESDKLTHSSSDPRSMRCQNAAPCAGRDMNRLPAGPKQTEVSLRMSGHMINIYGSSVSFCSLVKTLCLAAFKLRKLKT